MSLLEALRGLSSSERSVRREAAKVLMEQTRASAARAGAGELLDEVAQEVFLKLLANREAIRADADAGVGAWVATTCRHEVVTRWRRQWPGGDRDPADTGSIRGTDEAEARGDLDRTIDTFRSVLRRHWPGGSEPVLERTLACFDEMVRLALGRADLPDLLVDVSPSDPTFGKARGALYTRHKRAREAALRVLDAARQTEPLSGEAYELSRNFVLSLKRRRVDDEAEEVTP